MFVIEKREMKYCKDCIYGQYKTDTFGIRWCVNPQFKKTEIELVEGRKIFVSGESPCSWQRENITGKCKKEAIGFRPIFKFPKRTKKAIIKAFLRRLFLLH